MRRVLADNARMTAWGVWRGRERESGAADFVRAKDESGSKERPDRLPASPDPHAIIFCVIRSFRYAPAAVSPR